MLLPLDLEAYNMLLSILAWAGNEELDMKRRA
jgi:hypothetical protein